ncbi:MAG: putative bifunctional diguanylate cyclase/phosphodiesterase, partial [Acidimicrobiales bacterium]
SLEWMWEQGIGGKSFADIVRIDVTEHPDTADLFESTVPCTLGPEDIPDGFGTPPENLHLLYVPVTRNGKARLALSIENWGERTWSAAEIEAAQSVVQLISQLCGRVDAESAMVRRLEVEDRTRTIATDMLRLTNQTSIAGIHDALASISVGLELERAALWIIDHTTSELALLTEWASDAPTPTVHRRTPLEGTPARLAQAPGVAADLPADDTCIVNGGEGSVALALPLARAEQRATGLLVFERVDGKPWTSEDRRAIDELGTLIVQLGARLEAENYFATAFENAPVGISLRDSKNRLVACNRAFEKFVGRDQTELLGTTVVGTLQPHYTDPEAAQREFRLQRPDGTYVWGRVTEAKIRGTGDQGDLWLRHVTDITATRQAMEQLEYQAGHDELTGLSNRRVLMEQLRTCLSSPPRSTDAAVLLLDIDRFKIINDSLGHSTGDDVLRVIADRLRLAVRPQDVVCRLGGDEFVVLLRGPVSGIESAAVANRLLEMLSEPMEAGPTRMFLSASIGIANPTAHDQALEDVLRHADAAMYKAKSKGRNRFEVFDQRHRDALAHRLEIESDLRLAIDQGALELHYQPELELRSGRLMGAEALVRWPHPRLGMLSAGSFIEVAEDSGLVVELGRLVLDRACRQAAAWNQNRDHPLTVRVNLSAHQLDRPELVDEVRSALQRHQVHPEHLCLEITETALMSDVDESLALLERLREVGVRLAIDDFGTGFSSLAYLKRFPVDVLKIDQTFVRGLGQDRDDEAIVRSVINMAGALDLEVVAEGIETPEHRRLLVDVGCFRGQGFDLARPATPEDLAPLIAAGGLNLSQPDGVSGAQRFDATTT